MPKKNKPSSPMPGPLVGLILAGFARALGSSYQKIIVDTPWARFLTTPPSSDPSVAESDNEEWARVCAAIYQLVGKDLFIAFGRYAGVESARLFVPAVAARLGPEAETAKGLARLRLVATLHTAMFNAQEHTITLTEIEDGVLVTVEPCDVCRLIKSDEPICTYISEGLRTAYATLTKERVVVGEVECQALGQVPYCRFKVTLR
jgi:predicted hydrocarbon binding protein